MEALGWGVVLLVLKWVFIGLVYLVLAIVLLAVRREMATRIQDSSDPGSLLPGRLRVLQSGSDGHLQPGTLVSLKPVTRLGSERDNDIVLRDHYISAYHARLRWDGVNWWVEDLDSRNGTYIQQERIPANEPQQINQGAMLRLGDVTFELLE